MNKTLIFFLALLAFSCKQENTETMQPDSTLQTPTLSYLALGDSYTIGESVEEGERWPVQLADALTEKGIPVASPRIIAQTGWTTNELDEAINQANITENYDLVSLLIGVNNQYRGEAKGFTTEGYRNEFKALLQRAIGFAGNNKERVFVVSIPDYGVTPFASSSDTVQIREELEQYNTIAKEIASEMEVAFLNITPISQEAREQPELVAPDGLHPSGEMYSRWVEEVILPALKDKIKG